MKFLQIFLSLVIVCLIGTFLFQLVNPSCNLPVRYSMGSFDDRFGVSKKDAESALREAESLWENSLGRDDIFSYEEDSSLKINFVYDERQRQAAAASQARKDLLIRGDANEVLVELHKQLVAEYSVHESSYNQMVSSYETELLSYNEEVENYNSVGGAPAEAYQDLEDRRIDLDRKRREINSLNETMDDLVNQINSIGEKGNELITEYNERVNRFNDAYIHDHEYTQGDYRSREINVYAFTNRYELVLVLAHELGHALGIEHVNSSSSVMYYLMGGQSNPLSLSEEDRSAFATSCEIGFLNKLLAFTR